MAGPHVIVFGRISTEGPVKTRLAATIGAEAARAMYDEMALTTFLVADRSVTGQNDFIPIQTRFASGTVPRATRGGSSSSQPGP